MSNDTIPVMRKAFRTTVSCGGDKPSYEMVFRFSSMSDLHAADDEWRALVTRPALPDDVGAVAPESEDR